MAASSPDKSPSPMAPNVRERFRELCQRPDSSIDLGLGAALIAAEEYEGLEPERLVRDLDRLAAPLAERLRSITEPVARLRQLTSYLHDELGFRGNTDDYYDPKNSFLPDVLERRVGIPITLALIFIEVGKRAGVPLVGVAFPGHFLLRFDSDIPRFLDPFEPGTLMTPDDTRALFVRLGGEAKDYDERFLRPASQRTILVRMLRNLKLIYLKAEALEKATAVIDRILMLCPDEVREYRDRGIAYMKLEAYLLALPDLCHYLENASAAPDRAAITAAIDYLRDQVASLN
jgi:regulator of sirC expression with transglutaminase-like and TPR domain